MYSRHMCIVCVYNFREKRKHVNSFVKQKRTWSAISAENGVQGQHGPTGVQFHVTFISVLKTKRERNNDKCQLLRKYVNEANK